VAKVAGAVHEAAMHMVAARLGVGYGISYIGHNGSAAIAMAQSPGLNRTGPEFPPRLSIRPLLYFASMIWTGSPLAILVNYACHPLSFNPTIGSIPLISQV